jgi:putative addiction module component (TIGR02574 family)
MGETVDELLKRALGLDEQDRASIAGALIESLHVQAEAGTEKAWDAEIQRRVRDLEARAVETVSWSKVRELLFRGFE